METEVRDLPISYEVTEDMVHSRPTVTRLRTGMFSAQDGLFLASFLAVTIVVAFVVRVVCRRYCGLRCSHCAHKQDPAMDDTPSIVMDITTTNNSSFNQQQVQPQIFNQMMQSQPCNPVIVQTRPNRSKPVQPRGMQTVFEEDDETEELQQHLSLHSLNSTSSEDIGVVYAIYAFPQTSTSHSPDVDLNSSNLPFKSYDSHSKDLPPSYEDLFPIKEESESSSANSYYGSRSNLNSYSDVQIDIESKTNTS